MLTLVHHEGVMALDTEGDKFSDGLPHPRRRASDRRDSLEARVTRLEADVKTIKDGPTDIRRLNAPATVIVSIVLAVLTVAIFVYGLRSDIRNVQTSLDAQTKSFDERYSTLKETIAMMDKKQELQRLEIQSLKEMILRQGAGNGQR